MASRAHHQGSPNWRQLVQSLRDWAAQSGVPMHFPSKLFAPRSAHAMRFCCALEDRQNDLLQFAKACFDVHYTDQLNLDDPVVLVQVANSVDLDGETLRLRSQDQVIKDRLRSNTEEAVSRGAFGSPSVFVPFGAGERLYFGNDQLPLVAWALRQEHA